MHIYNRWILFLSASSLLLFICFVGFFLVASATATSGAEVSPQATQTVIQSVDKIVVYKAKRVLHLLKNGKVARTYKIALGQNPIGHKQQEGDGRTPEGKYTIVWKNYGSAYHKSLKISYPNAADKNRARQRSVSPGGDIFIHGLPNGIPDTRLHTLRDWTLGCVAVTNAQIDEMFKLVKVGTVVELKP